MQIDVQISLQGVGFRVIAETTDDVGGSVVGGIFTLNASKVNMQLLLRHSVIDPPREIACIEQKTYRNEKNIYLEFPPKIQIKQTIACTRNVHQIIDFDDVAYGADTYTAGIVKDGK